MRPINLTIMEGGKLVVLGQDTLPVIPAKRKVLIEKPEKVVYYSMAEPTPARFHSPCGQWLPT